MDRHGEVTENSNDGTDRVDPNMLQQREHQLEDKIAVLESSSTKSNGGKVEEGTNRVKCTRNTRFGPGNMVSRLGVDT